MITTEKHPKLDSQISAQLLAEQRQAGQLHSPASDRHPEVCSEEQGGRWLRREHGFYKRE